MTILAEITGAQLIWIVGYLVTLAVVIAIEYALLHQRWLGWEDGRRATGILTVVLPTAALALTGFSAILLWFTICAGFMVAFVVYKTMGQITADKNTQAIREQIDDIVRNAR